MEVISISRRQGEIAAHFFLQLNLISLRQNLNTFVLANLLIKIEKFVEKLQQHMSKILNFCKFSILIIQH